MTVLYSNCGQLYPKARESVQSSSLDEEYPWPNDSTTIEESDTIASAITFDDIDNDGVEDVIFISESDSDEKGTHSLPIIRIVESGTFTEIRNLQDLAHPPSSKVKIFTFDVDLNSSAKELLYVSADGLKIVVVDYNAGEEPQVRQIITATEPITFAKGTSFVATESSSLTLIDIGDNLLIIRPTGITIESASVPVDGAWSTWSDWNDCSRKCGDGIRVRMRVCNNPAPRNDGANCAGVGLQTQACRIKACIPADCKAYEKFEIGGNCVPKTGDDDDDVEGDLDGDGDVDNDDKDTDNDGIPDKDDDDPDGDGKPGFDCEDGKVWDPKVLGCYKPYPVTNIFISARVRVYNNNMKTYVTYNHARRLSLNHAKAKGVTQLATARKVCRFSGHDDVISFTTGTYVAPTDPSNVFVLCDYLTNGFFFNPEGSNKCVVGDTNVSFRYEGINHSKGQTVVYLKDVVCRKSN